MSSGVSTESLQLNLQLIQGVASNSSKISASRAAAAQEAVYAKKGDANYNEEMDANEDGAVTYEEFIKYCEEHAASTYNKNPGFTKAVKTQDSEAGIQSVRPLNIGKALSTYSQSGIKMPEAHIKSEA